MGHLGAIWGFFGVTALLVSPIFRLAPYGWEALTFGLSWWQWGLLAVWVVFMLVTEGYRGFQQKFSPRTAARIRFLRDNPSGLRVLLAPIFCMGFFYAERRTKIVAYALTIFIILFVLLIKLLPQPWRGIIDVGVVLGLTYGTVSFLVFSVMALTKPEFEHSPEVPRQTD
ncbi:MAG: hypothetical protein AAF236_13920 [Verrucomicrobiota bacterium]